MAGFCPKGRKLRDLKKRKIEKQYVFKWEDKRHEKQDTRKTQVRRSDWKCAARLPVSALTCCLELDETRLMLHV